MNTPTIARVAWPVLLAVGVLTGCSDEPGAQAPKSPTSSAEATTATASGPSVAELDALLVRAAKAKPYSATMKTRTLMGGQTRLRSTARYNLNAPLSGYMKMRGDSALLNANMVITDRFAYVRQVKASGVAYGSWKKMTKASLGGASTPVLGEYARLLLKEGPTSIKGRQTVNGVRSTRLSGTIATDDIRTVERGLYDRLRVADVDSFACDIWIDRSGRTIRLEQWIKMQGQASHNVMTISKFRPAFKVKAPTT